MIGTVNKSPTSRELIDSLDRLVHDARRLDQSAASYLESAVVANFNWASIAFTSAWY